MEIFLDFSHLIQLNIGDESETFSMNTLSKKRQIRFIRIKSSLTSCRVLKETSQMIKNKAFKVLYINQSYFKRSNFSTERQIEIEKKMSTD